MSEFKKNHTLHVTGALLLGPKTRDVVDRVMKMRAGDVAKHGLAAVGFSYITVSAMGADFRVWVFEAGPENFEINTAVEDLVRYKEAGALRTSTATIRAWGRCTFGSTRPGMRTRSRSRSTPGTCTSTAATHS